MATYTTRKTVKEFFYSDGRIGNEAGMFSDEIQKLNSIDPETIVEVSRFYTGSGPDVRLSHHFSVAPEAATAAELTGGFSISEEYIIVR